ncbi:hypothetical protein GCM10023205_20740 [Yinghuangia aomiensis]|uniref:Uncharacterized protein n=1 Tax=Yinghuangia aomiensis TaxID=676205 RepID=A0ABP9H3C3_9ACTN
MPGSTTLSRHASATFLDHTDAERLLAVVNELARMTVDTPNRLSDAQVAALCGPSMSGRAELAAWLTGLSGTVSEQQHHGLGHA